MLGDALSLIGRAVGDPEMSSNEEDGPIPQGVISGMGIAGDVKEQWAKLKGNILRATNLFVKMVNKGKRRPLWFSKVVAEKVKKKREVS